MAAKKSAPKKEKPLDKKAKKVRVKDEPIIVAEAAAPEKKSSKRGTKAPKPEAPVKIVTPEPLPEEPKSKRKGKKKAESLEPQATALIAADVIPEVAASEPETAPAEPAVEPNPRRKGKKKKPEATPADSGTAESNDAASDAPAESTAETAPASGDESAGEKEAEANPEELIRTIEALLFAAEEPIAVREIARAAGSDSATVRKLLPQMIERYDQQRRPWTISEIGGGYRLMTRPEFFPAIQRLKTQTAQRKLTQAALETLALIAYRQPIGRAEVESVRGVGAGPVIRILLEKKLIKINGRGTGIGQPLLYGTTDYFLEHFGLKSIADLPKPGEFKGS